MLAGLPRAPSRINPRADPAAAAARGREVLAAMAETGAITKAEADAAAAKIAFPPRPATAGWFADWVADASETVVPAGADAVVHTTLDSRLQSVAETRLDAMLDGPGATAGASQGAVIVLDAATGAVRAMVGGRDYRPSPFNRAVAARRQPGSAFKPFVWLGALEHGMRPDDLVLDGPIRIGNWSPQNIEHGYRRRGDARGRAGGVAQHRLGAAAAAGGRPARGRRSGAPAGHRGHACRTTCRSHSAPARSGCWSWPPPMPGCSMAACWSRPPGSSGSRRTSTPSRSPERRRRASSTRISTPRWSACCAAVVARGTGRAAAIPGKFVAGKTGTTQDYRDAWFVGVAGRTVIGVWLGNDDDRPMRGVTGSTLPARLFHDIAAALR